MKLADVIRPHLTNGRGWCDGCRKRVGDPAEHIASIIDEWVKPAETPAEALFRPLRGKFVQPPSRPTGQAPLGMRSWEE